jgi:hypothetical protein
LDKGAMMIPVFIGKRSDADGQVPGFFRYFFGEKIAERPSDLP